MIIEIIKFFGITADNITPVAIVIAIGLFLFYKFCIKTIKESVKNIDDDLTNVNNATCEIQSHFTDASFTILHPLTMKPGSPLVMTDYGEKLVKESGFFDIFQGENKTKIVNAVKARNPQTNYDIQEYSKDVLLNDFINDSMMQLIKEYAFKKPISIKIVLDVAALVVRDAVMDELKLDIKKHPTTQ